MGYNIQDSLCVLSITELKEIRRFIDNLMEEKILEIIDNSEGKNMAKLMDLVISKLGRTDL